MARSAAFIDFQGTLGGSGMDDIRSMDLYPFSYEAVRKLNDACILAIGITNQSHISKGALTWEEYENELRRIKDELSRKNAYLDAVYCCPHAKKDKCNCKKPKTGMIDLAKSDFDIDISKSFVVGDMGKNDIVLARNIGAKGILVLTGVGKDSMDQHRHTWPDIEPDYVAENVLEAVGYIISTKFAE